MRKINICLFLFTILFISFNLSAQTYSTGKESNKADANLTELANYFKEHPEPLVRKRPLSEEENEDYPRPSRKKINLADIHLIDRNRTDRIAASTALPASSAPNDTFLSTVTNGMNIPPDTHGAVDSQYCLTVTNTAVHLQTRTGTNVANISLNSFWHTVLPTGTDSYDPRVFFDPYYNRWIMVTDAVNLSTQQNSYLMVAVSASSNPNTAWHYYAISIDATNATWLDFPTLGFNQKWITISGNMFTTSGTSRGAVLYVFDYASIMAGTGAPFTKITESSLFTLCPAVTYDPTQQSMFCIDVNSAGSGKLQLWKITGPVASPTIASVGFPATTQTWHNGGSADFAPQLGSTNRVQAGDDRITNLTYRNQKLWCAHTVFLPNPGTVTHCSVMWWQIDTLANPLQNGLIDNGVVPNFYDYPSISANKYDDALIGFSYLSANTYPSAAYAMRYHTDPTDSMRPAFVFRHGQANYFQNFGHSQNRWGDYSATTVDPVNDIDFWTIQESVPSSPANYWDTWWAYVKACPATANFTVTKSVINKNLYDTLTFTGTEPAGTTFAWNFGGGVATPGTGAGPQSVKWTTYGWKVVILKDSLEGCASTFVDSILVENQAGENTVTTEDVVKIVPNPNNGAFDMVLGDILAGAGTVVVSILNEQGRVVYSEDHAVNAGRISVKTDNLPPGNYIANIYINENMYTQKITIVR